MELNENLYIQMEIKAREISQDWLTNKDYKILIFQTLISDENCTNGNVQIFNFSG